jgi:hypothetical protein
MADDREEAEVEIRGGLRVQNVVVRLDRFEVQRSTEVTGPDFDDDGNETAPRVSRRVWVWNKTLLLFAPGASEPFASELRTGVATTRAELLNALSSRR